MASVTKSNEEKSMADDALPDGAEPKKGGKPSGEPTPLSYARKGTDSGPAYFTIYKKGQGYWTRIGTLAGALVIGAFTAYNLYVHVPTFLPAKHDTGVKIATSIVAAFVIGFAILCWRVLNKPTNVDFLIATDSEMKKVNWTSRKELIGSTRIVIIFMFLVSFFLFAVDTEFGQAFYYLRVTIVPPISYSVNVEKLAVSDIPATDVISPTTIPGLPPLVLAPARQPIGSAAVASIQNSGLSSVSVVPSALHWFLGHLAVIAVAALAIFLRLRHEEKPSRGPARR
jgi:preprotein translocase SecE subunit